MDKTVNAPDDTVICFPQSDIFEVLRNNDADMFKKFTIEAIDDGDVLHVTASLRPLTSKHENSKEVGFKFVENISEYDKETCDTLISEVFQELGDSNTLQITLLIGVDNLTNAYIRKNSTELPTAAEVIQCPSKDLLYSRHRGILESSFLEKRKVAIIGLGSGGSHIAIELAKAGVGRFVLIDNDRIELSNIIRHTCGVRDLGRFKTKAIRDHILQKNPFAEVLIHNFDINDLNTAVFDNIGLKDCNLLIGATDNTPSRGNIESLAFEFGIPVLFGKCRERASGGDVVIVRPGKGPCISCICGKPEGNEEISSFRQARQANPAYVSNSTVEATIQVGLSSDIIPISNMVVKIALVELCRGSDSALKSLEEDFRSVYYVWANRSDANYMDYDQCGLEDIEKTSILRWYAVPNIERKENCWQCNPPADNESSEL